MEPIKPLRNSLILYEDLIEHLCSKGKSKNWFDAIRTRYDMRHEPIIKPYDKLIPYGRKSKHGRRVFYLQAIIPYLDEIIDLHDNGGFTYPEIEKKMKDKTETLNRLRDININVDENVEPESFFMDFLIAKAKIGDFYGWGNGSQDMKALNHIYNTRQKDGRRYFELTEEIHSLIKEGRNAEAKKKREERDKIGHSLNYCRTMMMSTIQHCADLVKNKKIDITEEDKKYAESVILKR